MRKILVLVGAAVLAGSVSAWAAETALTTGKADTAGHTTEQMTQGMHAMHDGKQTHMVNKAMPSRSLNCTEEALAKMPVEHRAACGKRN